MTVSIEYGYATSDAAPQVCFESSPESVDIAYEVDGIERWATIPRADWDAIVAFAAAPVERT